jgi:hypothetical protein
MGSTSNLVRDREIVRIKRVGVSLSFKNDSKSEKGHQKAVDAHNFVVRYNFIDTSPVQLYSRLDLKYLRPLTLRGRTFERWDLANVQFV